MDFSLVEADTELRCDYYTERAGKLNAQYSRHKIILRTSAGFTLPSSNPELVRLPYDFINPAFGWIEPFSIKLGKKFIIHFTITRQASHSGPESLFDKFCRRFQYGCH